MKFINKYTKAVLETDNEFVIEQMKKSAKYEELKVTKKEIVTEENNDEILEEKPKRKKADKEEI
jgi:hypothetical protein